MVWHEQRSSERHVIELPVKYRILDERRVSKRFFQNAVTCKSRNISEGGLLFLSPESFEVGTFLELSFPVKDRVFVMEGKVVHITPDTNTTMHRVGIYFPTANHLFKIKMAEQLHQIHEYQQQLSKEEGRIVSEEEAAHRWIEQHSGQFAKLFRMGF